MADGLERFQAKWAPVRVKKTRKNNNLELGEMMIYASFALMVWHWLPVVILAWIWIGVFATNMALKEASVLRA